MTLYKEVIKFNPPGFPTNKCPAGGLASNPSSVVCFYHITDHCLVCVSATGEVATIPTCRVFNPGGRDGIDRPPKIPINDYIIGKLTKEDGRLCYMLYPKNKFNTGFKKKASNTLYVNDVHDGGVAIDVGMAKNYKKSRNWLRVRSFLDKGELIYKKKNYCGFLHVIP
ncbi:uncharacterized protein LOC100372790 [Saccoglossus kowalevskii]